jgi:hypothetical protein
MLYCLESTTRLVEALLAHQTSSAAGGTLSAVDAPGFVSPKPQGEDLLLPALKMRFFNHVTVR